MANQIKTEGISETTVVLKKTMGDGSVLERVTRFKSYLNTVNPRVKKFFIGYTTVVGICYASYSYDDGKNALHEYRTRTKDEPYSPVIAAQEWKAIRPGIKSGDNFWSSIFFPWTVTEKIMPSLILFANPHPCELTTGVKTSILGGYEQKPSKCVNAIEELLKIK